MNDARLWLIRAVTLGGLLLALTASARAAPSLMFLVDQSGGMSATCSGASCFNQVRAAMDSTLNASQAQASFGLSLFTGDGGASCPMLSTVPLALNNRAAINNLMNNSAPSGEKPLADAINASVSMFANTASPRALIAVFINSPDTCAQPSPNAGFPAAIAAAAAAYSHGISTFVVSLDGSDPSSLQNLANAGAGLPVGGATNAPFFVTPTPQLMSQAFNQIVAIELASPVPATSHWWTLSLAALLFVAVAWRVSLRRSTARSRSQR